LDQSLLVNDILLLASLHYVVSLGKQSTSPYFTVRGLVLISVSSLQALTATSAKKVSLKRYFPHGGLSSTLSYNR